MNKTVYVVTHKDYRMPDSNLYSAIAVGPNKNKLSISSVRDDSGDNISSKNNQYSELTALYWIWKNDKSDVTGIVHYRRYLSNKPKLGYDSILNETEIDVILKDYQIIVAKPRFYLEGVAKHYINCHKTQHDNCKKQLSILESVINEMQPDYLPAYRDVMKSSSAHMFNMFITSRDILSNYCNWLFPILFETEKRIDIEGVSYERLMGSLSEFLLDVWIKTNNIQYKEVGLFQTEMDFWKRVKRFLYRRFLEK